MFQGIARFEGRSSLKTWLFHILMNKARTRAKRESRVVAYPLFWEEGLELEPTGFGLGRLGDDGHWTSFPRPWPAGPEGVVLASEARAEITAAIARLPENLMEVITLRDVEGFSAEEVCELLELTPGNQRVLLHRARTTVRQSLGKYVSDD